MLLGNSHQDDQEGFKPTIGSSATRAQNRPTAERESTQIEEITEEQTGPDRDDLESGIDMYPEPTVLPEILVITKAGQPQRNRRLL